MNKLILVLAPAILALKFILGTGLVAVAIYQYEKSVASYNPEEICAKQKDVSVEQCRSAISMAMSAGW